MKIGLLAVSYIYNERQLVLAMDTMASFQCSHELVKMCIISGGTNEDFANDNFDIIYKADNCLAANWNFGIDYLLNLGCDYVIIPNLDISLEKNYNLDELISLAEKKPNGVIWTAFCVNSPMKESIDQEYYEIKPERCWDYFSLFMVNKRLKERVGQFDENYRPAYGEDIDMLYRCSLLNEKVYCATRCRFFHHGQTTMKNKDGIMDNTALSAGGMYLTMKFGDIRGGKGYPVPFQNPNIPIKWYRTFEHHIEKKKTLE